MDLVRERSDGDVTEQGVTDDSHHAMTLALRDSWRSVTEMVVVPAAGQLYMRAGEHQYVDIASDREGGDIQLVRRGSCCGQVDLHVAKEREGIESGLDVPSAGSSAAVQPPALKDWFQTKEPTMRSRSRRGRYRLSSRADLHPFIVSANVLLVWRAPDCSDEQCGPATRRLSFLCRTGE